MASIEINEPHEINIPASSIYRYVGFAVAPDKPEMYVLLGNITDDGAPVAKSMAVLGIREAEGVLLSFRKMLREIKSRPRG